MQPPTGYFYGGPTSPPGSNVGGLPYLPLQDSTTYGGLSSSHTRFNTYPGQHGATSPTAHGLSVSSPRGSSFSPLVPPAFREGRGRNSPFSSPAPSPPTGQSPAGSPPQSSSPLPQVGGGGAAGRRLRSPPPSERTTSAETSDADEAGGHPWSPATDSTSSTLSSSSSLASISTLRHGHGRRGDSESSTASSVLSSPESDATSVGPDSPNFASGGPGTKAGSMTRPSNALEFSNFLDRYRFHLGSAGAAASSGAPNGNVNGNGNGGGPPSAGFVSPSSQQTGFFNFAAASPVGTASPAGAPSSPSSVTESGLDSNSSTPQRLSPLAGAVPSSAPPPAPAALVS